MGSSEWTLLGLHLVVLLLWKCPLQVVKPAQPVLQILHVPAGSGRLGSIFPSWRFCQGRGLTLAFNNHRCTVPSPLPSQYSAACTLHSVPLCGLRPEKPPSFASLWSIRQAHWVGANLSYNSFSFLVEQLRGSSYPACLSLPFLNKSLWVLTLQHWATAGLPIHSTSPVSQESISAMGSHGPLLFSGSRCRQYLSHSLVLSQ